MEQSSIVDNTQQGSEMEDLAASKEPTPPDNVWADLAMLQQIYHFATACPNNALYIFV